MRVSSLKKSKQPNKRILILPFSVEELSQGGHQSMAEKRLSSYNVKSMSKPVARAAGYEYSPVDV